MGKATGRATRGSRTGASAAPSASTLDTASASAPELASSSPSWCTVAFDHAPVAMAITNELGTLLRVNQALCELLGRPSEEFLGRTWRDFAHPDDLTHDLLAAARPAPGSQHGQRPRTRLMRPDRGVVWGDLSLCEVAVDSDGARIEIWLVLDVTALVLAERQLLWTEDRYRLLAENTTEVVCFCDIEGTIEWISPAVQRALGHSPTALIGSTDNDLAAVLRANLPTQESALSRQLRVRGADDRVHDMFATIKAVNNQRGERVGFVAALREVTDLVAARQCVDEDRERLRATMDSMIDPLVVLAPIYDEAGRIFDFVHVDVNKAAARHTNRSVGELIGRTLREVVPGQAEAGLFERYDNVIRTGVPMILDDVDYKDEQQGGDHRVFDIRGVKVGDAVSITFRDVTERRETAAAVAASEALFRAALESAPIGMAMTDMLGRIVLSNGALSRMLQRSPAWLAEHNIVESVEPADLPLMRQAAADLMSGTATSVMLPIRLLRADGSTATTQSAAVLLGEDPAHFLLQVMDRTGEVEARAQLAYRALHDTLTGLRNRDWVMDVLEVDLASAARTEVPLAVFFVDLDKFKVVNDSLGHIAGDEVLKVVAERLTAVMPSGAQLARFGGDEFVAILPGTKTTTEVERIAERLSDAVSSPLTVLGHTILPTVSVGIAVSHSDSTAHSLLRDADSAANRAKESGRARWHFFDERMHSEAMTRLTLEGELRRGLRHREFLAHFQPIVDLSDYQVVGHEALVRWHHPILGLMGPKDFLAVAEESGLIIPMGWQVLEHVCQVLSEHPELPGGISVNFSGGQLGARDWLATVMSILRNSGVDPRRLVLEVTETAALAMRDSTKLDLRWLRDVGVGIHVDDFGTGYSSISLLRDLPVTGLKLDASFVADLTKLPSTANALAAGLAGLAKGLNLDRIAEGIETGLQADLLALQGWTHGQGYLFSRPTPSVHSEPLHPQPDRSVSG